MDHPHGHTSAVNGMGMDLDGLIDGDTDFDFELDRCTPPPPPPPLRVPVHDPCAPEPRRHVVEDDGRRDFPVQTITTTKLVAMRKHVPVLIIQGKHDVLIRWSRQLEQSILRYPHDIASTPLRDETVLFMIKLAFDASERIPQPTLSDKKGADYIEEHINDPILASDQSFNHHCMEWSIAPGSDRYPSVVKLAIGRILGVLAHEYVQTLYRDKLVTTTYKEHAVEFDAFIQIMLKLSSGCNFDRIVDWYLHASMRTYLGIARLAYLRPNDTPMRMLPDEYPGDAVNRIVSQFRTFQHTQRFETADWAKDYDVVLFVTCIAMLRERIDDIVVPLCTNSELTWYKTFNMPVPFILCGQFAGNKGNVIGYVFEDILYCMPSDASYPVPRTIMAWSERCALFFESRNEPDKASAFQGLNHAIHNPHRTLVGNKYGKIFGC